MIERINVKRIDRAAEDLQSPARCKQKIDHFLNEETGDPGNIRKLKVCFDELKDPGNVGCLGACFGDLENIGRLEACN